MALLLLFLLPLLVPAAAQIRNDDGIINNDKKNPSLLTTTLSNGVKFPLIGLGVGNLQHDRIVPQIVEAVGKQGTRMIDTAHSSNNHRLVKQGIEDALQLLQQQNNNNDDVTIHVVTKIWYTHLGYERTKLAAFQIFDELDHPNIRVHILIHWPRCRDDVPWMDCEREESELDERVRNLGDPIPHLNKDTAYILSWRALQDIYNDSIVAHPNQSRLLAGIGVSNFDISDFEGIMSAENNVVVPHILQGNVWSYINNPRLIEHCQRNKVHFQAYNIINGIFGRGAEVALQSSPIAYRHLIDLNDIDDGGDDPNNIDSLPSFRVPPHQIVMLWLIRGNHYAFVTENTDPISLPDPVSVIPRTSNVDHVRENSNDELSKIIHLLAPPVVDDEAEVVNIPSKLRLFFTPPSWYNTDDEKRRAVFETDMLIADSIRAMLQRIDLNPPEAVFRNHPDNDGPLHIYWKQDQTNENDEKLHLVKERLEPGEVFQTQTYPGHTFVVTRSFPTSTLGSEDVKNLVDGSGSAIDRKSVV